MNEAREIMTPEQVAEYLQLATETVYRFIREGLLPASRIGRQYRVSKSHLEYFLMATCTAGGASPRQFSRGDVGSWLEEDRLDPDSRVVGDRLLSGLR